MTPTQPRPVRDNNPGDLDSGEPWQGLMPRAQMNAAQLAEPRFCVFLTPAWGFRALAIVLRNYGRLYGDDTVRAIITRFAPPVENATSAYIANVSTALGVDADAPLDLGNAATLSGLCRAIATQEAGGWFFATADLQQGVNGALGQTTAMTDSGDAGAITVLAERSFVGKRYLVD